MTIPESAANPRTPFGTTEPILPVTIDGIPIQTVINDPITLLQEIIEQQVADGPRFRGAVLNIATQVPITFFNNPSDDPGAPRPRWACWTPVAASRKSPFYWGISRPRLPHANAQTALVYATFWIEKVTHPNGPTFDMGRLSTSCSTRRWSF
jgi:hypothetical protein